MVQEREGFAHPFDVVNIPHVDRVVVVDAGEFVVLFVVGYGDGVGVFGIGGSGSHVTRRRKRVMRWIFGSG